MRDRERKRGRLSWLGCLFVVGFMCLGGAGVVEARDYGRWGVGFAGGGGYTMGSGSVAELPALEIRYHSSRSAFMDIQLSAPLIISAGGKITAPFQLGWAMNGHVGSDHVQFFVGLGFAFALWSTPVRILPLLQFLFPLRLGLQVYNSKRTVSFQIRVSPAFVVQAFAINRESPSYQPFPTFQILGEMVLTFYLSRS